MHPRAPILTPITDPILWGPAAGMVPPTPYQSLIAVYTSLDQPHTWLRASCMWAPVRMPPYYIAQPDMSVLTTVNLLSGQPPHFLHTLNNTYLYPTPSIDGFAPRVSSEQNPIQARDDHGCRCEHCTRFNRRRRVTEELIAPNEEPAGLSDPDASTTVSHRLSGVTEKANEGNPELALLLNLPKDESVFYEWWKFTPASSLSQAEDSSTNLIKGKDQ